MALIDALLQKVYIELLMQMNFVHGESEMNDVKCCHCDGDGFCKKYSNDSVVWKCKGDADCEGYLEAEEE